MVCPVDNTPLVIADRQGIEIDYCPKCRGVWLDRGELDKVIDRAASYETGHQDRQAPQPQPYDHDLSNDRHDDYRDTRRDSDHGDRRGDQYSGDRYGEHPKKRKREGFLGDMFDFGD